MVKQWVSVTSWFQRGVHDSGRSDRQFDAEDFERKLVLFEMTLSSLARGFFDTMKELDEILDEANS